MERKPDYEELARKLAELEEIIGALRTREVDAIVGTESILYLRLRETEERLREQRDYLEQLVGQRTAKLEAANEELRIARDELETRVR